MTTPHEQLLALFARQGDRNLFSPEDRAAFIASPAAQTLAADLGRRPPTDWVVVALQALMAQRDDARAEAIEVRFVATLPGFVSAVARPTEAVLTELLDLARAQIVAVGYGMSEQCVLARLQTAAGKGVQVTVVTDRQSGHGRQLLAAWPQHLPKPTVLQEKANDVSEKSKMHGKALLVDGQTLYISSANFTWLAMNANIELGVVLSGPGVGVARELFDELLVRSGLLERVAV